MLRSRLIRYFLIAAALVSCAAAQASPYLIDQRDPKFQQSHEHLARAAQALAVAQRELGLAQAAYPLPGLDYPRIRGTLTPVEDTLRVLLSPERKRHAHNTVVPDGIFFTPINTGD